MREDISKAVTGQVPFIEFKLCLTVLATLMTERRILSFLLLNFSNMPEAVFYPGIEFKLR